MSAEGSPSLVTPDLDRWLESNAAKKEFKDWWTRYRSLSTDLVITRKLSTFIAEELDLMRILYNIRELDEDILNKVAESWIRLLEKLGIDRFSIKRGEIHGLRSEIVSILKKIFPMLEHYSAPVPFKGFRPREEICSMSYTSSRDLESTSDRKMETTHASPQVEDRRYVSENRRPIYSATYSTMDSISSRHRSRVIKITISIIAIIIISLLIILILSSLPHICIPLFISRAIYYAMRIIHKISMNVLLPSTLF
ncbi:MAG: hypothetical protein GXO10_04210 [Crenarchaeota archaeon]|nr:hypothetical protein [Thermoproteota archaeon]